MGNEIRTLLERTALDIKEIYQSGEKDFLSEDDFKCTLFSLFDKNIENMNLSDKFSVHTEVSYYGGGDNLKYRPDLSIFKKKLLKTNSASFDWSIPEKGVASIIEIKFIKKNRTKIYEEIEKDLKKLSKLSKNNKNAERILQGISYFKNVKKSL